MRFNRSAAAAAFFARDIFRLHPLHAGRSNLKTSSSVIVAPYEATAGAITAAGLINQSHEESGGFAAHAIPDELTFSPRVSLPTPVIGQLPTLSVAASLLILGRGIGWLPSQQED